MHEPGVQKFGRQKREDFISADPISDRILVTVRTLINCPFIPDPDSK